MRTIQRPFIEFECPHCSRTVSFPQDWRGSVQDCPWCSQSIVVPERPREPAHEVHLSIRTPRLLLRRFSLGDERDVHEIMSDTETFRYLDWETLDDEDVRQWLERDSRFLRLEVDRYFYFGAELLTTAKLIGLASFLYRGQECRDAGFNIVVNRSFRGQGYGAEIVGGVLEFAFRELNLQRLAAGCDSRNASGLKMLQKAGMRREGEFVEADRIREEWVNTVWFAKLRREYGEPRNEA